jgi:methylphosphotriester-DNA--protein-cysteine methyltransferase
MKAPEVEKYKALGHKPLVSRFPPLSEHKNELDKLCQWIDEHLSQPIGWQELMAQSHLDHQTIHALFFKYESTTPMTWIRRRREARSMTKAALPMHLQHKPAAQQMTLAV